MAEKTVIFVNIEQCLISGFEVKLETPFFRSLSLSLPFWLELILWIDDGFRLHIREPREIEFDAQLELLLPPDQFPLFRLNLKCIILTHTRERERDGYESILTLK